MQHEKEILDLIPGGIVVVDQQMRISFANEWILSLIGFSGEEIRGKDISLIFPELKITDTGYGLKQAEAVDKAGNRRPLYAAIREVNSEAGRSMAYMSFLSSPVLVNVAGLSDADPQTRETFFGIVGRSARMQEVYGLIELAAATDSNVVILGESGTGKELVASAVHDSSRRAGQNFVRVNCAALSETLLESELFGHVKGAFTGAYRDHAGKFEFAAGGTILLDEIAEISPSMQAKLLRVLQERVVVRVGDNREIPVDVRVIVSTNKNLRTLVSRGKFREDLFYRLNVFPVHIPALRERSTDIPLLIEHFISKFNSRTGKQIRSCSPDALRFMMEYCWPGNVRELQNTIEHAFVVCQKEEIGVVDLPHELRVAAVREGICAERKAGFIQPIFSPTGITGRKNNRLNITLEMLEAELLRHNGNKAATARALGISKVGLWKKMKKMGMG